MTIEPTDEDIAAALKQNGLSYTRANIQGHRAKQCTIFAHALTIAKLRHAETLIAERDAEIARLSQPILYQRPEGANMDEWRKNVYPTDLYHRGDTVLVWINESSIYLPPFVRAQPLPKASQP